MNTLSEIRKLYPEFKDKSDADLSTALHSIYQNETGLQIPYDTFNRALDYNTTDYDQIKSPLNPNNLMQPATGAYQPPIKPPSPTGNLLEPLTPEVREPKQADWSRVFKAPIESWPEIARSLVGAGLYHYGESRRHSYSRLRYNKEKNAFELPPLEKFAETGRDMYMSATRAMEAKRPQDMTGIQQLTYDSEMMLLRMAPVFAAGITGAPSIVGLAPMFAQVRWERYAALRASGMNHSDAKLHADMSALIEVGTENVPFDWVFAKGPKFLKRVLRGTVGEGLQESLSGILQSMWDKGTIKPDMTWNEALREAGYEGVIGTIGGAAMGAAAHPFVKAEMALAEKTPNYKPLYTLWKQPNQMDVGKMWPDMVTMGEQDWLQNIKPEQEQPVEQRVEKYVREEGAPDITEQVTYDQLGKLKQKPLKVSEPNKLEGRETNENMNAFFKELRGLGFSNPFLPSETVIMREGGDKESGAAVDVMPWYGRLHLSSIRSLKRGEGNASYALNKVIELADKNNLTIELDPKPFKTGIEGKDFTLKQLKAWYKRHGFKEEGARMVREPQLKVEDKVSERCKMALYYRMFHHPSGG